MTRRGAIHGDHVAGSLVLLIWLVLVYRHDGQGRSVCKQPVYLATNDETYIEGSESMDSEAVIPSEYSFSPDTSTVTARRGPRHLR